MIKITIFGVIFMFCFFIRFSEEFKLIVTTNKNSIQYLHILY